MAEGSNGSDGVRREERARSGDEVAAARRDVEETRAEITETVDTLQEKLQPQNLEEQARARATDEARARGRRLLEAIRQNPVPVAGAGGVLGLLLLARRLRRRNPSAVVFDLRKGTIR